MSQPEINLDKFTSAVMKDAQKQRDAILKEMDEYRSEQMARAEEEFKNEADTLIQKETAAIKNRQSRSLSLAELESRRNLLKLREKITQKVFGEASQRILEFTKSDKYADYLLRIVSEGSKDMPEGPLEIQVKKDDLVLKDRLRQAASRPATVVQNANIILGGAILYARGRGLIVDETLDLKLEGLKDWFSAESGLGIGL
jgi:V/A-type H+-transporting ATPase subunit E